nr:MAG TPA: Growth/differentiation factor [Caudoviricetes sp.]
MYLEKLRHSKYTLFLYPSQANECSGNCPTIKRKKNCP